MTRQERRLLNRTRQSVSWLVILCIILGVWLNNKYGDVSYAEMEKNTELAKDQKVLAISKEMEEAVSLELPMLKFSTSAPIS